MAVVAPLQPGGHPVSFRILLNRRADDDDFAFLRHRTIGRPLEGLFLGGVGFFRRLEHGTDHIALGLLRP